MELYPGWSARDNYGYVSKKKKRKKDRSPADSGGIALKFMTKNKKRKKKHTHLTTIQRKIHINTHTRIYFHTSLYVY